MDSASALQLFMVANQMAEHELNRVEREHGLDLLRRDTRATVADSEYYPQIEHAFRSEASAMAPHYEVFYALERTIRLQIADSLEAEDGPDWWNGERVPDDLQSKVAQRQAREVDAGIRRRSDEPIDFATFGELGELIKSNWDVFGSLFSSVRAVERVMSSLNTLRGPIAHCSPLAEDEVVRLNLTVKDWFRLMD